MYVTSVKWFSRVLLPIYLYILRLFHFTNGEINLLPYNVFFQSLTNDTGFKSNIILKNKKRSYFQCLRKL